MLSRLIWFDAEQGPDGSRVIILSHFSVAGLDTATLALATRTLTIPKTISDPAEVSALIMAGGRSERMRASGGEGHKALAPVLGIPLLERNLCQMLAAGVRDIAVAVSAREKETLNFAEGRASDLARRAGAQITILEEREPLGTIGAARLIASLGPTFVIYVDNLTTLDFMHFLAFHQSHNAVMTAAVHRHRFRIPFGEVRTEGDRLIEYREKPELAIDVSSGIYILSPESRRHIPQRRFDTPELVGNLIKSDMLVAAYVHEAEWIDINDRETLMLAESMVAKSTLAFEPWRGQGWYHEAR